MALNTALITELIPKTGLLSQMALIQWGGRSRWEVKFPISPEMPAPFDKFIPAQSISFTHQATNDLDIEVSNTGFKIPASASPTQVTLTLLDDISDTVLIYFETWMDYLTQGGTATLAEATRPFVYNRLGLQDNVLRMYYADVYPTGNLQTDMDDTGAIRTVSVTLNITSLSVKQTERDPYGTLKQLGGLAANKLLNNAIRGF